MSCYIGIENTDNYDHIYQSDLCGWVGQLGYNKETIYGANVYTADSDENLVAASFYATGKDSEYQIYLVKNFENVESLSSMKPVAIPASSVMQDIIQFRLNRRWRWKQGNAMRCWFITAHREQCIRSQ